MTNTRPVICSGCTEGGKDISNLSFYDLVCKIDSFANILEPIIKMAMKQTIKLFLDFIRASILKGN